MKIAILNIVANIGDVWRPCGFRLIMRYFQLIDSLKIQHRQRLPDRQEAQEMKYRNSRATENKRERKIFWKKLK